VKKKKRAVKDIPAATRTTHLRLVDARSSEIAKARSSAGLEDLVENG